MIPTRCTQPHISAAAGYGVVVEPESSHGSGPEVLHDDVGVLAQVKRDLASFVTVQVHAKRALSSVVVQVERGDAAFGIGEKSGDVAGTVERFYLGDVGALIGKQHGGKGSRDHLAEVNDLVAVHRSWHGLCPFVYWSSLELVVSHHNRCPFPRQKRPIDTSETVEDNSTTTTMASIGRRA